MQKSEFNTQKYPQTLYHVCILTSKF